MSHMGCPRCNSTISTTMAPSDHTGYFISDRELEALDSIRDRVMDVFEWFEKHCYDANHCPYCGYIWTYDPKPRSGYQLDDVAKPASDWKPPPLLTLECQTPHCEDRGGYIRRSQADLEASGVIVCDLCHQPYVVKKE